MMNYANPYAHPNYLQMGAYGHPPMMGRYMGDELDVLRGELEQEDRLREQLEWSNGELERSIGELEEYVKELEENNKNIDDNEWKVRYESQTAQNKQLQEQKDWLETELAEARRKLTTGSYPEAMNFNLDALTESELLRLVKHLERMRNDFYSTLRDTEWKLDKEAKEFHHFDEMRRVYRSELKHANSQIERLKFSVLDPSTGLMSPLYPAGYLSWLETHSPVPGGSRSKSLSPVKTPGGGGGGGGDKDKGLSRSKSKSPTRSKSRGERDRARGGGPKSKGKSQPPPPPPPQEPSEPVTEEEGTTPTKSEHEGDRGDEEEEEEEEEQEEEEYEEEPKSPSKRRNTLTNRKQSILLSPPEGHHHHHGGESSGGNAGGGGSTPSKKGVRSRDTSRERSND